MKIKNLIKVFIMLPVIFLFSTTIVKAQSDLPKEVDGKTALFFNHLKKSDVGKAIDSIVEGSLLAQKKQELNLLVQQMKVPFEVYGPFKSFEKIDVTYLTKNLLQVRYLVMFGNYPTRFVFTFYVTDGKWVIAHMMFDDQIQELF